MLATPFGAHLPWSRADEFLDLLLGHGLAPEIACKGPDLDHLDRRAVRQMALRLQRAKLQPTIHAPFFDLNPGALDPLIRQVSIHRLDQTMDLAEALQARLIVVHPGVDDWRYPGLQSEWLALACASLRPLVDRAARSKCRIALENIYEATPQTLCALVEAIDSPWFGHCFDIGHWRLFGETGLEEWLVAIGNKLFHLHLHDNHGMADEHLPVGDGTIAFELFFSLLRHSPSIPSVTLEAHSPAHLERSLRYLRNRFPGLA